MTRRRPRDRGPDFDVERVRREIVQDRKLPGVQCCACGAFLSRRRVEKAIDLGLTPSQALCYTCEQKAQERYRDGRRPPEIRDVVGGPR